MVAACGGDDPGDEAVVSGEGEIPASVPRDFPVPVDASIGSTLVDRVNHRTEFSVVVPDDMISVVQFYTVGLVNEGYVVDRADGTSDGWTLEFSRGAELTGIVVVSPQGESSQALVTLNRA